MFDDISTRTHYAKQLVRSWRKRLARLDVDEHKHSRQSQRHCKSCYYMRTAIVGHAFTDYQCCNCGKTATWHNTGVPKLCPECADRKGLCIRCGGDREWDSRDTKLTPPKAKKKRKKRCNNS
jgi:hypothetical protein